jgi:general secretion pathway protein M
MKLELSAAQQRATALGILAFVVLMFVYFIVWPMWQASAVHGERVDMLKRQVSTMESLADAAPRFDAAAKKLAANPDAQQLTFAAPQATLAVAQLQAQLSQIVTSGSGTVTSSQPMPEAREGAVAKITVQTTLETDIKGLVKILHAIDSARPLLRVEKLSVRDPDGDWAVTPQLAAPNKLQVDIFVSAFMRAP